MLWRSQSWSLPAKARSVRTQSLDRKRLASNELPLCCRHCSGVRAQDVCCQQCKGARLQPLKQFVGESCNRWHGRHCIALIVMLLMLDAESSEEFLCMHFQHSCNFAPGRTAAQIALFFAASPWTLLVACRLRLVPSSFAQCKSLHALALP